MVPTDSGHGAASSGCRELFRRLGGRHHGHRTDEHPARDADPGNAQGGVSGVAGLQGCRAVDDKNSEARRRRSWAGREGKLHMQRRGLGCGKPRGHEHADAPLPSNANDNFYPSSGTYSGDLQNDESA